MANGTNFGLQESPDPVIAQRQRVRRKREESEKRAAKNKDSVTFDLSKFAQSSFVRRQTGLQETKLTGIDENTGSALVTGKDPQTGEEKTIKFNQNKFLQSKTAEQMFKQRGKDPSDVVVRANTPETALDENPLNFLQQMDIIAAKKMPEKKRYLQDQFGKENVKFNKNTKEFLVKDPTDGAWKKAESGFLARLAKESPVTGGAIAGATIGTSLTAGIPVPGARVVGLIGGGAVGAAMGRLTDVASAELAGIRTESDAQDAMNEMGKEFIDSVTWDVLTIGGGKALKFGTQIPRDFAKGLVEDWAQTATQFTGVGEQHFRTLFDNRLTRKVLAAKERAVNWTKPISAGGKGGKGPNPNTVRQVALLRKTMREAKEAQTKQFSKLENELQKSIGLKNIKVDMNDVRQNIDNIERQILDEKEGLGLVLDNADKLKLKRAIRAIKSTTDEGGQLNFSQVRDLRRRMDGLLEKSGAFKSEFAIGSQGRAVLKGLRNDLNAKLGQSLQGKQIVRGNTRVNAKEVWDAMNARYSQFRDVFDDFAVPKKVDLQKAQKTVRAMFGKDGDLLQGQFDKLTTFTNNPTALRRLDEIRALEAGTQLEPIYSRGSGGAFEIKRIVGTVAGLGSPRKSTRRQVRISRTIEGARKINESTVNVLQKAGKFVEFQTNMSPRQFNEFIRSPQLFRSAVNATLGSIEQEESASRRLTNAAINTVLQQEEETRQQQIEQQEQQSQQRSQKSGGSR